MRNIVLIAALVGAVVLAPLVAVTHTGSGESVASAGEMVGDGRVFGPAPDFRAAIAISLHEMLMSRFPLMWTGWRSPQKGND